jgi:[ribosomal protein S5]-alanine N-acetyltransferase
MRPGSEIVAPKQPELTDGRVVLRQLTDEDVTQRYVDWLNDEDVNRWLEIRWERQTLATVLDFVHRVNASPTSFLWGIFVGGKHIGNIKIGPINDRHFSADCSYFIGERAEWGKGLATVAVKLATEFAFKKLRLHRVQAGAYGGNKASQRVLRKAGFALEGTLARALKTPLGWDDHLLFGRIVGSVAI